MTDFTIVSCQSDLPTTCTYDLGLCCLCTSPFSKLYASIPLPALKGLADPSILNGLLKPFNCDDV